MSLRRAALAAVCALGAMGAAACGPKEAPPAPRATPTAAPNANASAPVVPATTGAPMQTVSANGQELFAANCASCHLASGMGDPHHKKDDIPDFTNAAWQARQDDDEIANAIRKGKGKIMPAFGAQLSEPEIAALVAYVRGFPDRPAATPEPSGHPHR